MRSRHPLIAMDNLGVGREADKWHDGNDTACLQNGRDKHRACHSSETPSQRWLDQVEGFSVSIMSRRWCIDLSACRALTSAQRPRYASLSNRRVTEQR